MTPTNKKINTACKLIIVLMVESGIHSIGQNITHKGKDYYISTMEKGYDEASHF